VSSYWGQVKGVTEMLSERLAWLSFPNATDFNNRRSTFDEMRSVYRARSKAVHGDPVKELAPLVLKAEELASLGIFACAQLPSLFRGEQNENKLREQLKEFFVRLKLEGLDRAMLYVQKQVV
jgi:hypothetical protein